MTTFTRAREFRDTDALITLVPASWLKAVNDSAAMRFIRFKMAHPNAKIEKSDRTFRNFVNSTIGSSDDEIVNAMAAAFSLFELKDPGNKPALEILRLVFQFPAPSIVITESSFSFARGSATTAVFYLSETWSAPLVNLTAPKRFTVEWQKIDGNWMLDSVR